VARGRVRDDDATQRILDAAYELTREHGPGTVRIDDIAGAAGVGKQTIYRWWPSRHALVADVILEDADRILRPITTSDDVAADVCAWAVALATALTTARGNAMLRILTTAGMEHPDTAARLHSGFSLPLHATVRNRLSAGGFDPAAAQDASDAIVGGIVYAILSEGRSFTPHRAESITRMVIAGICAR